MRANLIIPGLLMSMLAATACGGAGRASSDDGRFSAQNAADDPLVAYPDPSLTPGATFPDVTAAQVCTPGYSSGVRNVPSHEKLQVFSSYAINNFPGGYEVDHFISLELGGTNDITNLWPQPYMPGVGAREKDQVENYLHAQLCSGAMTLQGVQDAVRTDWYAVYRAMKGLPPVPKHPMGRSGGVWQGEGAPPASDDAGVAGDAASTDSSADAVETALPDDAAPEAAGSDDAAAEAAGGDTAGGTTGGNPLSAVKNVFVIVLENHNWSDISTSASAPFIHSLLATSAHAEAYQNPSGVHPSEPNYLWLEAGTNFGIHNDYSPATNHQSTTSHLVTQLEAGGISWKSYQQGIDGVACPTKTSGLYAPKHNPMVFFDDVRTDSARCIAHVRPIEELSSDLSAGSAPRYSFITPDLCHDMHGASACSGADLIADGDAYLQGLVTTIQGSSAYADHGAIFITWDESEGGDVPIGMIVVSSLAKPGFSSSVPHTHSATLRTLQTIFRVGPMLGDAASSNDLSEMFTGG